MYCDGCGAIAVDGVEGEAAVGVERLRLGHYEQVQGDKSSGIQEPETRVERKEGRGRGR